ncbi:allantoinase AllB [Gaiella sp.]
MGDFDVLVRGGLVVGPTHVVPADLAIADGLIVEIGPEIEGSAAAEIDATGLHVFPGCVDPHVHLNDPGTDWEGFSSGTEAFALGGGTCLFDMPLNASPPTVDGPSFDLKVAAAREQAHTDFCLWGGLVPGDVDRLDELAERGVIGFKAFMCDTGVDEFPAADDLTLYEGMARAARLGLPVAVHAESDAITMGLTERARREGRTSVRDYLETRPPFVETEAVARAILLAEETGCALHVVHVSTAAAAVLVAEARSRGVDVSCETCPQYLLLTDEDAERIGALAKCSPAIRPRAGAEALWGEVGAGRIPMLACDHSPAPPELKQGDDAFSWWGGISGLQTLRGTLLAVAQERGLTLPEVAGLTAGAAAERFALPRKGRLEVGFDADLALVDLGHEGIVERADLRYRYPQSPFVGMSTRGRVVRTLLRGDAVIEDGRLVPNATFGRIVRPEM